MEIVFNQILGTAFMPDGDDSLGLAYGRFQTWRAIGALVGLPESASFDEVYAAATAGKFGTFYPMHFGYDYFWSFGLYGINKKKRQIIIVSAAWTD